MNRRDLAILGAVVLIGGFAALDALRDQGNETGGDERPQTRTEPSGADEKTTTRAAPSLPGRLVYMDSACRVRELELATQALADRSFQGTCGLWGPARSGRIAFAVGSLELDSIAFRVIDIDAGARDYGTYRARPDSIVWTPDGRAVAWCETPRRGWHLVLGSEPLRLPRCPVAYTRSGELAFVRGRRLLLGTARTPARPPASAPISAVSFGNDGSLALVVGNEILRYGSVGALDPTSRVPIRDPYDGSPLFAPDNCAALLRFPRTDRPPTVTVVGLECGRPVNRRVLPATAAAWSPDGQWFAVAEQTGIGFRSPAGAIAPDRWSLPEHVDQIVWKEAREAG